MEPVEPRPCGSGPPVTILSVHRPLTFGAPRLDLGCGRRPLGIPLLIWTPGATQGLLASWTLVRSRPVPELLMFARPDVLVEAQVRSSVPYWLARLMLAAGLGFVLSALGYFGILVQVVGLTPSRPIFWLAWLLVSSVVILLTWVSE